MIEAVFKKNLLFRIMSYIILLPFIPVLRPLIYNNELKDIFIYTIGFLLTLSFIIYSNNKPYIKINEGDIHIHSLHNNKLEVLSIDKIQNAFIKGKRKIKINLKSKDPIIISLSIKEQMRFLKVLESLEIEVNTAYHN